MENDGKPTSGATWGYPLAEFVSGLVVIDLLVTT